MAENDEKEQTDVPDVAPASERPVAKKKQGSKSASAEAPELSEHLDDQAASVAEALGVTDQDDDAEDADAPKNRAYRRRQRALARRAKRAVPTDDDEEIQQTEKDRNRRNRQALLRRRQQSASAEEDPELGKLLPAEMVDDALARGGAATIKWVRRHLSILQWVVLAGIVGVAAVLYWAYRTDTTEQASSDALARGLADAQAVIIPKEDDKRSEDDKKYDPRIIFTSHEKREEAALKEYREVAAAYAGSGTGILAKLGEAGVLYEQAEWDKAIVAFDVVLASKLAPADVDVRGRALEGKAFAQEGKGEVDKALTTLAQMKSLPAPAFKFSADFHTARLMLHKGETEKAVALLKETRSAVEKANLSATALDGSKPYRWLEKAVEDTLRRADPTALPPKPAGGTPSPEAIRKLLQQQGLDPNLPLGP